MPDVDTDGTIWYYWASIYTQIHNLAFYQKNYLIGYPFGYDLSYIPFFSLVYEFNKLLIILLGNNWQAIVFVTNLSALASYPLAGLSAYLLAYYLTKNHLASFVGGTIFAFSYYHILQGRGSLSLNHTEFFALFFLTLLYFMDKRDVKSLILSVVMFSFTFLATAYYGFFALLFSVPIFLLYGLTDKRFCLKSNLKDMGKYYLILLFISFFATLPVTFTQYYVFNPTLSAKLGRVVNPQAQLLNIIEYFVPPDKSFIYPWGGKTTFWGGEYDTFAGYAGLFLGSFALVLSRNHRDKRAALALGTCLVIGLLLSSSIPYLQLFNAAYFYLFGYFRAVDRINLFISLFLGILASLLLNHVVSHALSRQGNKRKAVALVMVVALAGWAIAEGLTTDSTWYKTTDFAKIAQLYEPLRDNPQIGRIIAYPFSTQPGFPQNYLLLGQVIFEKPVANGIDPQNPLAIAFAGQVSTFNNGAISTLEKYCIDTILVYTNFVDNATLQKIRTSPELVYLGHFEVSRDQGYLSTNDLSRSIDVFQIKSMVGKVCSNAVVTGQSTSGLTTDTLSLIAKSISAFTLIACLAYLIRRSNRHPKRSATSLRMLPNVQLNKPV